MQTFFDSPHTQWQGLCSLLFSMAFGTDYNETEQKGCSASFQAQTEKLTAPTSCLYECSPLKPSYRSIRRPMHPMERPTTERNWDPWSPAPAKLSADSRLQVTSHVIESWGTWILLLPLELAQPMLHIAENTYPSPDLQKLQIQEQNHDYCCFKRRAFEAVCYTARESWYTSCSFTASPLECSVMCKIGSRPVTNQCLLQNLKQKQQQQGDCAIKWIKCWLSTAPSGLLSRG